MLSNAYFLAKFRFDTDENEPAKFFQKFAKFANFAAPGPAGLLPRARLPAGRRSCGGSPEPGEVGQECGILNNSV